MSAEVNSLNRVLKWRHCVRNVHTFYTVIRTVRKYKKMVDVYIAIGMEDRHISWKSAIIWMTRGFIR